MNTPDIISVALIAAIFPTIATILTLLVSVKRFKSEQPKLIAEAKQENAEAAKTAEEATILRAEGYDKVFHSLLSRDQEILKQSSKNIAFEYEINRLTSLMTQVQDETKTEKEARKRFEHELMLEKERRVQVELERDDLKREIDDLKLALLSQRRDHESEIRTLTGTLEELRSIINQMKRDTSQIPAVSN